MKTYYQHLLEQHKVESGVPIPPRHGKILPWSTIKVGQCITIPCAEAERRKLQKYLSSQVKIEQKGGRKFTVRQMEKSVRVWRVK